MKNQNAFKRILFHSLFAGFFLLCFGLISSCAIKKKSSDYVLKKLSEERNGISAQMTFPVFFDYDDLSRTVEAFVAYDYDSFKKDVQEKNRGVEKGSKGGGLYEYKLLAEPRISEEYICVEITVLKKMSAESESEKTQKIFLYSISSGTFLNASELESLPEVGL